MRAHSSLPQALPLCLALVGQAVCPADERFGP